MSSKQSPSFWKFVICDVSGREVALYSAYLARNRASSLIRGWHLTFLALSPSFPTVDDRLKRFYE